MEVDFTLAKEGLVTLSGVPSARWTSIPDWEEIKVKNRRLAISENYDRKEISR
jgi:hypothetical protein